MGYDISADYVDSTTTYEPRSTTIVDPDFIGGHSKFTTILPNDNENPYIYIYRVLRIIETV